MELQEPVPPANGMVTSDLSLEIKQRKQIGDSICSSSKLELLTIFKILLSLFEKICIILGLN
jgi:hypothetical protein